MNKLVALALLVLLPLAPALPARADSLRDQQVIDAIGDAVVVRQQVPRRDVTIAWDDGRVDNMVPALPPGRVTLTIGDSARLGGRGSVPVQIWIDGRRFRTIFPRVEIQIMKKVLVAKGAIARGTIVSDGDVGLERTAISPSSGTYGQPLTSLQSVLGAEATREISAGTVLVAGMFKIPALIKAGQVVSVVVHTGDVTIIGRGEARNSGGLGQMIRVMNLDSKKEFMAKVAGPERVEIELEE